MKSKFQTEKELVDAILADPDNTELTDQIKKDSLISKIIEKLEIRDEVKAAKEEESKELDIVRLVNIIFWNIFDLKNNAKYYVYNSRPKRAFSEAVSWSRLTVVNLDYTFSALCLFVVKITEPLSVKSIQAFEKPKSNSI